MVIKTQLLEYFYELIQKKNKSIPRSVYENLKIIGTELLDQLISLTNKDKSKVLIQFNKIFHKRL